MRPGRWTLPIAAAAALYLALLRRRILTWGATEAEAAERLPGDELLGRMRTTPIAHGFAVALAICAGSSPLARAATSSTAPLPGVPCSVTATGPTSGPTMTYRGGVSCAGGAGQKTIDVVPQVFNRIHGKALWFNISLAGLYQGPASINPLRLTAARAAAAAHRYRVLVLGHVVLPDGRTGSATACEGSDCSGFRPLSTSPSFTYPARPATAAQMHGVPCTVGQNGLVFTLVNGSYVLNYGGYTVCTPSASAPQPTLTVCAQVANRVADKNVWYTITGSCLSRASTSPAPLTLHTGRTAYQGHAYRVKAIAKALTRTTTVFSGFAAP